MIKSLALALSLAVAVGATPASAQSGAFPPLKREPVLEEAVPATNPAIHLVRGAHIEFAPGQPTGVHYHPASTVGVVTEGSFRYQREGGPVRILKTGDSFFEPANLKILHFDNASDKAPAAIVVFYLTDSSDRPLIKPLDATSEPPRPGS